ncbi:hypothetical protein ACOSQ4_014741 [Xanthoceras sorbifolium]
MIKLNQNLKSCTNASCDDAYRDVSRSAGSEISGAGSVGVFCSSAASFDGKVSGARSAGSLVSGVAPSGGKVADAVGLCLGVGPVRAVWFGAGFSGAVCSGAELPGFFFFLLLAL